MILVSASTSYLTLTVLMREVSCVGYTPRAWNPRSLWSMLDGPLYFGLLEYFVLTEDCLKPAT